MSNRQILRPTNDGKKLSIDPVEIINRYTSTIFSIDYINYKK